MLGDSTSAVETLQWALAEKVVEPNNLDHAEMSGFNSLETAFGESFESYAKWPQMLSNFLKRKEQSD
jgi:hypothetical protein